MQVRKRNGNIVDYDREFIVRAVTLAAAAAGAVVSILIMRRK